MLVVSVLVAVLVSSLWHWSAGHLPALIDGICRGASAFLASASITADSHILEVAWRLILRPACFNSLLGLGARNAVASVVGLLCLVGGHTVVNIACPSFPSAIDVLCGMPPEVRFHLQSSMLGLFLANKLVVGSQFSFWQVCIFCTFRK